MTRLFTILLAAGLLGCTPYQAAPADIQTSAPQTTQSTPVQTETDTVAIQIGDQTFSMALADTEAAQDFAARLPMTLDMQELNGNEKYSNLDEALPTQASAPGQIETGDCMLYGDRCVVLFYEDFSTGYSYTPLGKIQDPAGLAQAVGSGSVTVTFAKQADTP